MENGFSPSMMSRCITLIQLKNAKIIVLENAGGILQNIRAKQSQSSKSVKDIRTQNILASMTSIWRTILQAIFIISVKRTDKMSAQTTQPHMIASEEKLPAKKVNTCGRTESMVITWHTGVQVLNAKNGEHFNVRSLSTTPALDITISYLKFWNSEPPWRLFSLKIS